MYKKLSGSGSNAKKLAFFAAFDDSVWLSDYSCLIENSFL